MKDTHFGLKQLLSLTKGDWDILVKPLNRSGWFEFQNYKFKMDQHGFISNLH